MTSSTITNKTLTVSEVMTPEKANFAGNIHGGYLMELCDRVAYACAARYASSYVVTLSVDQILFKEPIHVGELVHFHACINYVGHSSMEVGIKVVAENIITRHCRHTNSCYFTMVAVDEKTLRPISAPPLTCSTPEDKRRFEEAAHRRELRHQVQAAHAKRKRELKAQYTENPE